MKIDYNTFAAEYARDRSASPAIVKHVLAAQEYRAIADVLEIGCGTADHLYILSKALGAHGHGFDLSEQMLAQAVQKNPGLSLLLGDANQHFPYPDASFDLVYSVNVIHYILDLARHFTEALRVLRPGGWTVTVTDSAEDIQQRTMAFYFPEIVAVEQARYHPIAHLEDALHAAGFARVWVTHTYAEFTLMAADVEKYRNRAYSSLRLISPAAFESGLAHMVADFERGPIAACELYTYVWGEKVR